MVLTLAYDYSQIVEPACSRRAACFGRHSRPTGEPWSPPDANVAKLCSSVTESAAKKAGVFVHVCLLRAKVAG